MLKVKNDIDRAEIYISGTIVDDEDGAAQSTDGYEFPRVIRQQLEQCRGLPLTVYIHSYGGSVAAGLAMANMLARHDAETTAIVDGVCASIATQIFFSANKCRMPANAYLFIHAPTSRVEGTAEDMRRSAEALDAIVEGLITTYRSKARETTSEEELRAMLAGERWLTGTEAARMFDIDLMSAMQTVNCRFERGKLKSALIPRELHFTDEETLARAKLVLDQTEEMMKWKD